MDDNAPSTSLNPDSPPFDPPPQPFLPPPIIILPNFPNYFQPPPPTIPAYPPPLHPYHHQYHSLSIPPLHPYYYQYHSLTPPPQFSYFTHLVAPPSQWPQFQYSHYFQQQPPQEELVDSRYIQDPTNFVSVGPRISSRWENNVYRPEIGESSHHHRWSADMVPLKEEEHKTTIMINSIPMAYTRELLLELLDEHCKKENERDNKESISAYDFVYLPFYFSSRRKPCNKGYAFVNFTNPKAAWKFYQACNEKPWNLFNSNSNQKIMIAYADKHQGKEALLRRYEQAIFNCDMDEYLPLLLEPHSDGSGNAQVSRRLVGKRISPS